jgi:hypothetical protein
MKTAPTPFIRRRPFGRFALFTSFLLSVALTKAFGACVTATKGGAWQNTAIASQPGTFTISFDATPSASPNNAAVALSESAQTSFAGFACIVRFNTSGTIDARNGGAYAPATSTIKFSANTTYHFREVIDVTAHTYSIFVTVPGGVEQTVGTNFAFRTEQNTVTSLDHWGAFVDSTGGSGSLTVCNFTLGGVPVLPAFSPTPGTYTAPLSVTITDSTAGATIYFTTDGSTPTTSSTVYTGPVSLPLGATALNAIAANSSGSSTVTSGSYTVNPPPPPLSPVFNPVQGTYTAPLSVTITDSTSGATIYYTTDGSTPTTSSAVYSGPVSLPVGTTTLNAIAANSNGSSTVTSGSYTVNPPPPPQPPVFNPVPGTYTAPVSVTITDPVNGVTIYYTTDGSTPTTSSAVYSGPVSLPVGTTTLSAIAANSNGSSTVTSGSYIVNPPPPPQPPVFNPVPGAYSAPLSVTITDPTSGVTIYYTTDGSTPTTSSAVYSSPVSLPVGTTTLSAIAGNSNGTSTVTSGSYTVTNGGGTVSTPVFSPGAGPFYAATPVTISSATPGVSIRYTTDGSTPTETNGTLYTGPVTVQVAVDTNMTASTASNGSGITMLKAVAYKSGMTDSAVVTGNFIIIVPLRFAKTTSMILGMAHMAYNVTAANWDGIYKIWTHDIGYGTVQLTGTSPNRFALIKINDQQFIELYEVTSLPSSGVGGYPAQYQLRNWGFYVTDAKAFQAQLQSAGVSITKSVAVNALGNLSFFTTDPDGHSDEWLQYMPGSVTSQTLGQNMPGTQLFGYIEDFGDATSNVSAADNYYAKVGFRSGTTKVYLPNNNCYMEMLSYTTISQSQAGVHEKTQLVNFRGFTIGQSGAAVVARDSSIPRVVQGSEGGSGFPSHAYYDLYNADLSRIRLIDINY